jgi:hypothetical protein
MYLENQHRLIIDISSMYSGQKFPLNFLALHSTTLSPRRILKLLYFLFYFYFYLPKYQLNL